MLNFTAPASFIRPPPAPAPAWADPRLLMNATAVRWADFETNMNVPQLVARADPTRVALGVFRRPASAQSLWLSPSCNPNDFAWNVDQTGAPFWLTIFEHGPLINLDWYATTAAQGFFRVVEVYTLT